MYCEKDYYQCLSQIIVKENKYYEFQQGKNIILVTKMRIAI